MLQKYIDKFKEIGSEIIQYPKNVTGETFTFRCLMCGGEGSYLSLDTFFRRKAKALCAECTAEITRIKKKNKEYNKVVSFVEKAGAKVVNYTKQLEPITLQCPGCLQEFTYSTFNNLLKRNRECFCSNCVENTKELQKIQENVEYVEKELIPFLSEKGIKIRQPYPINKDEPLLGYCSQCGKEHAYISITQLLFQIKKQGIPVCSECKAVKIGESQKKNNFPGFLKKTRELFKQHGSKLINKPQSTKSIFIFKCAQCGEEKSRYKFSYFRKETGNFICPDCAMKNAGKKKRIIPFFERGENNVKNRGNNFEYYNTWVLKIRRKYKKKCVISEETKKVAAHHIFGFKRFPSVALNFFNGVLLSSKLHREYHSKYGRASANYFTFQEFYKEKTGKNFYLVNNKKLRVDLFSEQIDFLELKKIAADKKINLIPLWWQEYVLNPEIMTSIFNNKIGKIKNRLFARNCEVREISSEQIQTFLHKNHRQGKIPSKINLGLFFKEELVSVMSLGSPRYSKENQYELLRFCSKLNTIVVGAASKLFTYFVKKYNPVSVISYCDVRFSSLDPEKTVYPKLGFKYSHTSPPNYFYYKDGKFFSRLQFQKHKLPEILSDFDPELSEKENMLRNGFEIMTDCGNHVFTFKK